MRLVSKDDYIYQCASCGYRGTRKEFWTYGNPTLRKQRTNDSKCPSCKRYRTATVIGKGKDEYVYGKTPED